MTTLSFATETVWNAGLAGTGAAVGGRSLLVGEGADWTPEHLLLLAAESSIMTALLEQTARSGVDLLGYVSNGRLSPDAQGPPQIFVSVCIVVGSELDAERTRGLLEEVKGRSVVARLLGSRLVLLADVRLLPCSSS